MVFSVGVWVCGCVSVYPTQPRNLTWLIKIEKLGYKMHSLITFCKEMENYFEFVHWTCRHFSTSCILHVGTLLSFPKLIPFLTICRYALRRWRDYGHRTSCCHTLLRAFTLLSSCTFSMYSEYCLSFTHAPLFLDRICFLPPVR